MEIIELTILTNDIDETEKFYNGLFGLTISNRNATSISFLTQNSKLTFKKSDTQSPVYHFAFNIPNNRIKNALTWTNEKVNIIEVGPKIKIADFDDWNARSFYFFDNNNNILEFIARFGLDNKSYSEFGSSSILSISEIGIPSDNVLTETRQTADKFGIAYFAKQPTTENFSVLGNDNGLLIYVENKRNWYPTNIQSERHWTTVKIKDNDKTFEIKIESNWANR